MNLLDISQLVLAILLMATILMQNKSGGLSGIFGGSGSNVYMTKRGLEKKVFIATIVFAILFFSVSLLNVVLASRAS